MHAINNEAITNLHRSLDARFSEEISTEVAGNFANNGIKCMRYQHARQADSHHFEAGVLHCQ